MPPEDHYERQLAEFLNILSAYRDRIKTNAKDLIAKTESDILIKSIANDAIKYHNEFPN